MPELLHTLNPVLQPMCWLKLLQGVFHGSDYIRPL